MVLYEMPGGGICCSRQDRYARRERAPVRDRRDRRTEPISMIGGDALMKRTTGLTALIAVCIAACMLPAAVFAVDITLHEISITVTPATHWLAGKDRLTVNAEAPGTSVFLLNSALEIRKISLNGTRVPVRELTGGRLLSRFPEIEDKDALDGAKGISIDIPDAGKHYIEIDYEGAVYDTLTVPDYSRGAIAEETSGLIGEEGVYLSGETHWYPGIPDDLSLFMISVVTPEQFEPVTEGKRITHNASDGKLQTEWEVFYPTSGVTLVAGRYIVMEEQMDGIAVQAYFFPSERDLMKRYIDASKRYIDMYNNLIGPYPFSKFAIVENFFPTGYGMPSYTLLGRRVLRLPWIIHTSLGHEVAHNWWGNSVYPDYSAGNWCEGLTVYYADHRYKEAISDSAAIDYRRVLDTDYTAYVNEQNDFPLTRFEERTTPASRAIGYGKCALVFHMLKDIVGEECFYRTLRTFYRDFQFKKSSWLDIQSLFEQLSGQDLDFYFDQWVSGTGAPEIECTGVGVDSTADGFVVRVGVEQHPPFRLLLPVVVANADTMAIFREWIGSPETTLTLATSFPPAEVRIDPRYDLFRRLSPLEIPPTISAVLGDPAMAVVLPTRADAAMRATFEALAAQLTRTGEGTVLEDSALTVVDLGKRSLLILGNQDENALLSIIDVPAAHEFTAGSLAIGDMRYTGPGHGVFYTFRSPFNPSKSITVIAGITPAAVEQAGYKIIHYGKYSYVVFDNGKRIKAGIVPVADNPMTRALDRGWMTRRTEQ